MFRASLCTSSEEQDRVLLHMVFCTGYTVCDCAELDHTIRKVTFTKRKQLHTTTSNTTDAEHHMQ